MARKVGTLAFGVVGGFVGGLFTAGAFSGIGFGIGMSIGGALLSKKPKGTPSRAPSANGVQLPFFGAEYLGTVGGVGGQLIQAGKDKGGLPAAIFVSTRSDGGGKGEPETVTEEQFLTAAFFIGATHNTGPLFVDEIEFNDGEGPHLIYNRWGPTAKGRGFALTPQYRQGVLTAELHENLRLYPGTGLQIPDTALQEWWGEDVSAYRFSSYVVFNRVKVTSQPLITFKVRSLLTDRRTAIQARLKTCVPGHRLSLGAITGEIAGLAITGPQAPREFAEKAARLADCDFAFDGARIVAQPYSAPVIHEIGAAQMGARQSGASQTEEGGDALENISYKAPTDLPSEVKVPFLNIETGYEEDEAPAEVQDAAHSNPLAVDLGGEAMTMTTARRRAYMERDRARAEDRIWSATLLPGACVILPGDVARVTAPRGFARNAPLVTRDYHVQELERDQLGLITPKGTPYYGRAAIQPAVTQAGTRPAATVFVPGAPVPFLCETVPLSDAMISTYGVIAAACAAPGDAWRGAYFDASGLARVKLAQAAPIGELLEAFTLGDTTSFDFGRTLRLRMINGTPQGATEALAQAGANTLLLETGRLLSFVSVSQTAPNEWDLSGIKDGRHGTDQGDGREGGYDIARTAPAGTRVLLLTKNDGAATGGWAFVKRERKLLAFPKEYQFYPPSGKEDQTLRTHILTGENIKPLAPVNVVLTRATNGSASLTGSARTRLFDDSDTNIPVGGQMARGETLSFEIRLTNEATTQTIRRTAAQAGAFSFDFSTADLSSLFGSIPTTLSGQISQVSDDIGPGRRRAFTSPAWTPPAPPP